MFYTTKIKRTNRKSNKHKTTTKKTPNKTLKFCLVLKILVYMNKLVKHLISRKFFLCERKSPRIVPNIPN